ncbi:MAG: hypothetical protein ACK4MQ_07700 [Hyphomonas sp.]
MSSAGALQALLDARSGFANVPEKDWAAAAGLIVKKLLISAGQTVETVSAIKAAVGDEIFETQLKSLTHHQARQLARRLDKTVPDIEVSTAGAAIAWVRALLTAGGTAPQEEQEGTPEHAGQAWDAPAVSLSGADDESEGEDPAAPSPASPNPYFGRRSFRS